ncbi:hypothetical protein [Streptomyces olivaceiscleroticus]|uniref:hypothetical protein n=1 Tax=Streptomyces olivaceiscleroticus TaxID=68245 RepID=UPI0031F9AA15
MSTALVVRSALDADVRNGLEQWWQQARLVRTGDGAAHNAMRQRVAEALGGAGDPV